MKKVLALVALVASLAALTWAGVTTQAGPYRIDLTSDPAVVALGNMRLIFKVTDSSGKPIDGLQIQALAHMPGMKMGERELPAEPEPGSPGTYALTTPFMMEGAYRVDVKISGTPGNAQASIPIRTGQNLVAGDGGFSLWSLLLGLAGAALLIFIVVKMRASGQGLHVAALLNRASITGVLLLVCMVAAAIYAVNHWRREGAMTPIEAQVMSMETPAPTGSTPVVLARVEEGSLEGTTTYSGQAVGYVDQEVVARVQGAIISMPVYVGDRVKKGQTVARLDTSLVDPQLAERNAMTDMAARSVDVAATEYQTALAEIAEARAQVSVKQSAVSETESMIAAAREDKAAAEAQVDSVLSEVENAQSDIRSATVNARYWSEELKRKQSLFASGAISRAMLQETERDEAEAQTELHHAHQMANSTAAKLAGARSSVKRAEAMIAAAQRRRSQADADVRAAQATIRARQSAAEAAKKVIERERAGLAQARAGYESVATQKGYSELKAESDGIVSKRMISPGTVVTPGQAVLQISQVAPIRLQANVPQADLKSIRLGTPVTIVSESGKEIRTAVRSISPALDPQSRTGVVEAVYANQDRAFSPGQFLRMRFETSSSKRGLILPQRSLQTERLSRANYVWRATPSAEAGHYRVEPVSVEMTAASGDRVLVTGLRAGDEVVISGFTNLTEGQLVVASRAALAEALPPIEVSASGFSPSSIEIPSNRPTTLQFVRISEEGCGEEVVFPELGIRRKLPLNEIVEIQIPARPKGSLNFSCGMDMLRGKVVVR